MERKAILEIPLEECDKYQLTAIVLNIEDINLSYRQGDNRAGKPIEIETHTELCTECNLVKGYPRCGMEN